MKRAWHQQVKRAPKEARTYRDGTVFDSKGEMERWALLQQWQLAGEIRNLRRQVEHKLIMPDGTPIMVGPFSRRKVAVYTPDFEYTYVGRKVWRSLDEGIPPRRVPSEEVIEEFKARMDPLSKFRIAVFEACTGKKVTIVRPK